jgi:hypothetical protein
MPGLSWSSVMRSPRPCRLQFILRYSPEGMEGRFCDLRLDGVLRRSSEGSGSGQKTCCGLVVICQVGDYTSSV